MSISRQNSQRISVSTREWLVCIFATFTLVFTAWSLGGYKNWALHLLFLGGLGTFFVSCFADAKIMEWIMTKIMEILKIVNDF